MKKYPPIHIAVVNTGWREPENIFWLNGREVLSEWYHEKLMRSETIFTPKYCDSLSTTSLLAKNETYINIHFTGYTSECANVAEKLIIHTEWDILTPDPRSKQVIHRRMYRLDWTSKPLLWKIVDNEVHKAMRDTVYKLTQWFKVSSKRYLEKQKGKWYKRPTVKKDGSYVYHIN